MSLQKPARGPRGYHRAALSDREALLFEAGIKLGGVFHQYLGTPVAPATAKGLARTIAAALALQPYVARATVRIDPSRGGAVGSGRFGYRYLTAEMLQVAVTLVDGPVRVRARLVHRPDLRYPLMTVDEVRGSRPRARSTPARPAARRPRRSARRSAPSDG